MGNLLSYDREFFDKLRAVETRAAVFQKDHGLSMDDLEAFRRISWLFTGAFVKHITIAGLLIFYVAADLDARVYRFPMQHTLVATTRKLRFFPNTKSEPLRMVLWMAIPLLYFSTVAKKQYATLQMREKIKLDTDFGRAYRRALYDIDPQNTMLQRYSPRTDYSAADVAMSMSSMDSMDSMDTTHHHGAGRSQEKAEVMRYTPETVSRRRQMEEEEEEERSHGHNHDHVSLDAPRYGRRAPVTHRRRPAHPAHVHDDRHSSSISGVGEMMSGDGDDNEGRRRERMI